MKAAAILMGFIALTQVIIQTGYNKADNCNNSNSSTTTTAILRKVIKMGLERKISVISSSSN